MKTQDKTPLTEQEIRAVVTVIDIASTRGAFRGNEMLGVGTLYNRLNGLIQPETMIQTGDKDEKNNGSNNQ
tara:strand:+ start:87 stop:299 length:213 start_codon:yes stop_codon:yes gene_type:complete